MNNSLKKYSEISRLFVIEMEQSIKKNGFAKGYNNVIYNDIDTLYLDIEKQLKKIIENGDLNKDISLESSMHIIKGTNPLQQEKYMSEFEGFSISKSDRYRIEVEKINKEFDSKINKKIIFNFKREY